MSYNNIIMSSIIIIFVADLDRTLQHRWLKSLCLPSIAQFSTGGTHRGSVRTQLHLVGKREGGHDELLTVPPQGDPGPDWGCGISGRDSPALSCNQVQPHYLSSIFISFSPGLTCQHSLSLLATPPHVLQQGGASDHPPPSHRCPSHPPSYPCVWDCPRTHPPLPYFLQDTPTDYTCPH